MFDIVQLETNKQKIQKDLKEISPQILALEVVDQETLDKATEYASMANTRIKRVKELHDEFKKPALDFGRMVDTWAKNLSTPYEQIVEGLKGKIKKYHIEQDRKAREAQEALRKQQEAEQKKLQEAQEAERQKNLEAQKTATPEQAQQLSAEDLIMQNAVAPAPAPIEVKRDTTTRTESGSSFTRKTWKFEIVDETLVPREFLTIHEGKIREAVKTGSREIPGVRIYEDLDVSIRA